MKKVLIACQARSTSTRLPGKIFELIGKKTVLQHVIDSCNKSAHYLMNERARTPLDVRVALLIPKGDQIGLIFKGKVDIYEGSEADVLSRYYNAITELGFDYICRITSDCCFIPPHIISRAVQVAVNNDLDYTENIEETCRTSIDGFDCEVLSKLAMDWLACNATTPTDKEHVTIAIREVRPTALRYGHLVSYFDASSLKISIDTADDLERCRREYEKMQRALFSHPDWMIFRV